MRAAALLLLVVALGACGRDDGSPATSTDEGESGANTVQISADDLTFSTSELQASAGQITIVFENEDQGIPHNIEVQGPDEDHATDIESGPVTQRLTFTIQEPGTYTFVCVVHPGTMEGQLVVG